jgi:hypothetical protein
MASYDIAQYLLDRANIQDTVTKNVSTQICFCKSSIRLIPFNTAAPT